MKLSPATAFESFTVGLLLGAGLLLLMQRHSWLIF